MVESKLESEKGEDGDVLSVAIDQKEAVGIEIHGLGLRKEPSFSRWCDEEGLERLYSSRENGIASVDDSDFELPSPHGNGLENGSLDRERQRSYEEISNKFRQRSIHLNGDMDPISVYVEGNGNVKKFAPFNIEDLHGRPVSPSFRVRETSSDSSLDSLEQRGFFGTTQAGHSWISPPRLLLTLFYILLWYTFSTCLTVYNKSLLGDKLGKFPAPFLMNTFHFTLQAILSKIIIWVWHQRFQASGTMSWRDYFFRVVPTALGTALDINLSNASLVFISVTFATMCKSASPIFLLLFAFAFKLETPSIKLMGIIFIISVGVLLTVAKEAEFELWGFIFVMLAAVMSGFRWSMTQILLQKEIYGLKNPLVLMSYVTPVMAAATALLSLIFDPWLSFQKNEYFDSSWHIFRSTLLMLMGGSLAFLMVLIEYILISETSAVTVTIAGVVKEAVTILVAVFYFNDQFTLLKGIGLFTIMVGVSLFNWYKYLKLRKGQASENDEEIEFPIANGAAKYVILEDMDDQNQDAS